MGFVRSRIFLTISRPSSRGAGVKNPPMVVRLGTTDGRGTYIGLINSSGSSRDPDDDRTKLNVTELNG